MASPTRPHVSTRRRLVASSLCALWLTLTAQAQQSSTITVAPADATISTGQTQLFAASGAVIPTGVSAGGEYACAGLSDGTVQCAGRNQFGQLANGTWTNSATLVPAVNLAG